MSIKEIEFLIKKYDLKIKKQYGITFDFYFCDAITLKTIERANPSIVVLEQGTILQKVHHNKLKKIHDKFKPFTLPNWYKLFQMIKTLNFAKWYCGETVDEFGGGVGRLIDHERITEHNWGK